MGFTLKISDSQIVELHQLESFLMDHINDPEKETPKKFIVFLKTIASILEPLEYQAKPFFQKEYPSLKAIPRFNQSIFLRQ